MAARPRVRRPRRDSGGGRLDLLRVLALYWYPKGMELRLAVRRHLHALDGPGTRVLYHNAIEPAPPWIAGSAPQLCILHSTFLGVRWEEDFERYRQSFRWVSRLRCPKVALPQDEYDHSEVLEEWLAELDVTTVYSCFGRDKRALLYPKLETRVPFRETLTGFVDRKAAGALRERMVPHEQRRADVVYRATKLPYWFGSHGQLKHLLAEAVERSAAALGLRTDVSARWEDTIYGHDWLDFLMSGRAVVGCESGSSVLDARGEIQRRIRQLLDEQPDLTFEEVDRRMPAGWDAYAFFALSPRHLEAVITKTAQVLVAGSYSGVLEPERHYIPVRRDLADLEEALARLQDVAAVEAMAERAYHDVYLAGHHTLEDFAGRLRAEAGRRARRLAVPFALAERLPVRTVPDAVTRWQPLQTKTGARLLLAHTLLDGLVRDPAARRLLVERARRRIAVGVRDMAWEVIVLRVLGRISESGRWRLEAETAAGTVTIRTRARGSGGGIRLDGPVERAVWDHSEVAEAAPLYPERPQWAWIPLGPGGRHEFEALAEIGRRDARVLRALLERTLER